MTKPNFKVKRGDFVQVMVGRYKGKTGTVKKVFLDEAKVIVEGVNRVVRFMRPTQACPEGKVSKTMPIHISNVALVDSSTDKPGKVEYKIGKNGKKERFFKKSGNIIERNFK
ncbi:MAG: 50S ribosomal protein L24 [Holosporales bacterium]|jgi:large subunit ribosomal protein L24|nr:50S ribosomal protein L24 [Holosporales bacterium]